MPEEKKEAAHKASSSSKDIEDNKVVAAIGYIGILFLVPLLAKKDSPYAQYHAKQGLVLFIFGIIIGVVMVIPLIGWVVGIIGWVICVVLFIMGLINALSGQMKPLPIIGQYGENMKI